MFLAPDTGKLETGAPDTKPVTPDVTRSTTAAPGVEVTSHGNDAASADPRVDLSRINGTQ